MPKRRSKSVASHPALARQWHPTKNRPLVAREVTLGSRKKVWWRCETNRRHVWRAAPNSRAPKRNGRRRVTRCPFCVNRRKIPGGTVAEAARRLARQWHPTRNGTLDPSDLPVTSKKVVWWQCPEVPLHAWRARVAERTSSDDPGCPHCAGRRAKGGEALADTHPEIAAQWHPTKNGELTANDVSRGSSKKRWWKCSEGDEHVWRESPMGRTQGRGCPFCSGRRVSKTNSLAAVRPDLARQWHPTKNGALEPHQLTAGSGRRVWWRCLEGPDHVWQTTVNARTSGVSPGCPFCSGRRVCRSNSLKTVRPELARQWDPTKNDGLRPQDVHHGAGALAWWRCRRGPDHVWEESIRARAKKKSGCPFCEGKRVSVTNSLRTLFPKLAREWHPTKNGRLGPKDVLAGARDQRWWKCPVGHVYRLAVRDRTVRGRGCPRCAGG